MAPVNGNTYGSLSDGSPTSSYNKLENGEATSERASLLVDKSSDDTDSLNNGSSKGIHIPFLFKSFLIAVAVACTTGLAMLAYQRFHTFREPHENHINPNYRQGPLSLLDPVADLGMYHFDRPLSSQPTVHRSLEAPNGNAALPTNSWYQSFLLLGADETPTSMHRAYSIPYILDAAGPIAGIRVYPHHVGATSNVIQTYTIENQGLTAGLATADGVSAKRRYQIELMTPLGITLSWVSHDSLSLSLSLSCCSPFVLFSKRHSPIASCFCSLSDGFQSFDDHCQGHAVHDTQIRQYSHCI